MQYGWYSAVVDCIRDNLLQGFISEGMTKDKELECAMCDSVSGDGSNPVIPPPLTDAMQTAQLLLHPMTIAEKPSLLNPASHTPFTLHMSLPTADQPSTPGLIKRICVLANVASHGADKSKKKKWSFGMN